MPFTAPESDLVTDTTPTPTPTPVPASEGGFTAPASDVLNEDGHTPFEAGQAYLQRLDAGQTPLPESAEQHYANAKDYFDASATKRLAGSAYNALFGTPTGQPDGGALSNLWQNTRQAVGNAGHAIYVGTGNVKDELAAGFANDIQGGRDAAKIAPTLADEYLPQSVNDALSVVNGDTIAQVPAAVATGLAKGAYNTAKPVVTGTVKAAGALGHDIVSLAGNPVSAGQTEAQLDFDRRQYENNVERPASQLLTDASGLPATESAVASVVPLAVPLADAANATGLIAKAGDIAANAAPKVVGRTLQAAGAGGEIVADSAPMVGMMGAYHGVSHGGVLQGVVEAAAGSGTKLIRPLATNLKNAGQRIATSAPSEFVRNVTEPLAGLTLAGGTEAAVQNNKPLADPAWLAAATAPMPPTNPQPLAGITRAGVLVAPAPVVLASTPPAMVKMRAPSGALGLIPANRVAEAQANGLVVAQ